MMISRRDIFKFLTIISVFPSFPAFAEKIDSKKEKVMNFVSKKYQIMKNNGQINDFEIRDVSFFEKDGGIVITDIESYIVPIKPNEAKKNFSEINLNPFFVDTI